MIGSDDVLACFIAGNAFTLESVILNFTSRDSLTDPHSDYYRSKTEEDALQSTVDMLLNL